MERQVSDAISPDDAQPDAEARFLREAEDAVRTYLHGMGFGAAAIEAVLPQCVSKARKRVGRSPFAMEELQRRAVEDVQRRIDRAMAQLLELDPDDLPSVARARTALLLDGADFPKDHLLSSQPIPTAAVRTLNAHLPTATPPENPLPMAPQTFRFIW